MRKNSTIQLISFLILFFNIALVQNANSQSPDKFSYQIILRDSENQLVKNTDIGIKISILKTSVEGELVYSETHSAKTNINGLATIVIGNGQPNGNIASVNWLEGPYYVKAEVDLSGGENYTVSVITEIMSVPYSLYAKTTESITAGLDKGNLYYWDGNKWVTINAGKDGTALVLCNGIPTWGGCNEDVNQPIMVVENKDNHRVLSVYQDGVVVNVSNPDNKSGRGGFAVGGFTTEKDFPSEFFLVNTDSVRVYIQTEEETKSGRGGFAVGGFTSQKEKAPDTFFKVLSDSTVLTTTIVTEDNILIGGDTNIGGNIVFRPQVNTLLVFVNEIVEKIEFSGSVTNNGGGAITQVGFFYNTHPVAETGGTLVPSVFIEEEPFTANIDISLLIPSSTYYARAFARNNAGVSYGEVLSFETPVVLPEVFTISVTDITTNSAIANASVSYEGGGSVTQRGFVWGISPNSDLSNNLGYSTEGTGLGSFSSVLTNLLHDKEYFIRAYAVNEAGVAYGEEISFVTEFDPEVIDVQFNVLNINNLFPIDNAAIDFGTEFIWHTGIDGVAWVQLLPGEYTFTVSAEGYEDLSDVVEVYEGMNSKIVLMQPLPETVIDADNNVYDVITIGDQKWLKSNLKTTKYNSNDPIYTTITSQEWTELSVGAYSLYPYVEVPGIESHEDMKEAYGLLYNYYAVETDDICPPGWRVPNFEDWMVLDNFLKTEYSVTEVGGLMKDTRTEPEPHPRWNSPNEGATNQSGFSALPAGFRNAFGEFWDIGISTAYWTSGTSDNMILNNYTGFLGFAGGIAQNKGASVRCIWNNGWPKVRMPKMVSNEILDNVELASDLVYIGEGPFNTFYRKGFVVGLDTLPTLLPGEYYSFYESFDSDIGYYSQVIDNLNPGVEYHVRAFAENEVGIFYSDGIKFSAFTVKDIDNNSYDVIKIGTQFWMGRNLETTRFNNGVGILEISPESAHEPQNAGITYYTYNPIPGDFAYDFGLVYSYAVVDDSNYNVCPVGWKVPEMSDWNLLFTELGGDGVAGGKMKTIDTNPDNHGNGYWLFNDPVTASNSSGFSAVPAGSQGLSGYYYGISSNTTPGAHFWSRTTTPVEGDDYRKTTIYLTYDTEAVNYSYGTTEWGNQDGLSIRCIMHSGDPIVSTHRVKNVMQNSATATASVIYERGNKPDAVGLVWSKMPEPSIEMNDGLVLDYNIDAEVKFELNGLTRNSEYFVRAFATIDGTHFYGNEISFKTYFGTVADIGGNVYNTVKIGNQIWMAENLRVIQYNSDGSFIPFYDVYDSWQNVSDFGAYTYHPSEGEIKMDVNYGNLYNWHAVNDARGLCPTDWRVPNDIDWNELTLFVDMNAVGNSNVAAGKLKATSIYPDQHPRWLHPNAGASDEFGFGALPGGNRSIWGETWSQFEYLGQSASFWSADDLGANTSYFYMSFLEDTLYNYSQNKNYGHSVRCIKNQLPIEDFEGGSGTEGDPYLVANAAQLNNVRNFLGAHFRQTANIDLGVAPWNEGTGWEPIGEYGWDDPEYSTFFTGVYDGNGFVIQNLTINRPQKERVGLFGASFGIGELYGEFHNIALVDVNVTGSNQVGALIGSLDGESVITNSYATGSVNGTEMFSYSRIGGLVGIVMNNAIINNSYFNGEVNGYGRVGGLAGEVFGLIQNCYATGIVSAMEYGGGLVGDLWAGNIDKSYSVAVVNCDINGGGLTANVYSGQANVTNSYWDVNKSGQPASAGDEVGLTTDLMMQVASFVDWDFENDWDILEDDSYPFLRWQITPGDHNFARDFGGGDGSEVNPYIIKNARHLNNIRNYLGNENSGLFFSQTADIYLGIAPWNEGEGWVPIGEYDWEGNFAFMGTYNGSGFMIDGVFIDREDNNQGLFGYAVGASIKNVNLMNVSLNVYSYSGSLLGEGDAVFINNCHAMGSIIGNSSFGGLIGSIYDNADASSINNCSFTGNIDAGGTGGSGGSYVGGLIGEVYGAEGRIVQIYNSFYSGNLNATGAVVGGFIGEVRYADIQNCYNEGSVYSGNGDSGGFIAYTYDTTVNDCYSTADMTVEINGSSFLGVFIVFVNSGSIISNSYSTGTMIGDNHSGGFIGFLDMDAYVVNCYNIGDSYFYDGCGGGCGYYNGGFIGWAERAVVENCFNIGNVIGTSQIGGFIGLSRDMTIINSFSVGNVDGINNIGGFIGQIEQNSHVENSYSAGIITSSLVGGGFIAVNFGSTVNYSFYDSDIAGVAISAGGIGKSTPEMKDLATFVQYGWDFKGLGPNELWNIGNDRNNEYPYLNFQFPSDPANPDAANNYLPFLSTDSISNITINNASVYGNLKFLGNPQVYEHGFCINTEGNPTTSDLIIPLGIPSATGVFSADISSLSLVQGAVYYVKAFAVSSYGVGYGEEKIFALAPNGEGIEANPYIIESLADLLWISLASEKGNLFSGQFFRQDYDIDASVTSEWNNGFGWAPIGKDYFSRFAGNYNGNGKVISGLHINRPENNYVGLFGYVDNAVISELGLMNSTVIGKDYVGILAGYLTMSQISKSFSTGEIIALNSIGGLVGLITNSSSISDSYSTANVEGFAYVGGLCGSSGSSSSINRCYSKGLVVGTNNVSGLVSGFSPGANFSYWDMETSGLISSSGGIGLVTEDMLISSSFVGWDFLDTWSIVEGVTYPFLLWQGAPGDHNFKPLFAGGDGTLINPYLIETPSHLSNIRIVLADNVDRIFFRQIADIDLNVAPYNEGQGWIPIGETYSTVGNFEYDGNGYSITNLYINNEFGHTLGLFSWIEDANINNVRMTVASIYSGNYAGILAGRTWFSNIVNCTFEGVVIGDSNLGGISGEMNNIFVSRTNTDIEIIASSESIGGFFGMAYDANIMESFSTGTITVSEVPGFGRAGGIIGSAYGPGTVIENAYSTVTLRYTVLPQSYISVGGIVGYLDGGSINNCYSVGKILESGLGGGLIGVQINATISNSYWDMQTSGQTASDGGTGLQYDAMTQQSSFVGWDFGNIWDIDEGNSYPFHKWQIESGEHNIPRLFSGGKGTETEPYEIAALKDLKFLSENFVFWDKHFIQTGDINASETVNWNFDEGISDYLGFSPIGTFGTPFTGSYDGAGFFISDLFINRALDDLYVGFFGGIDGALISNVNLIAINVVGMGNTGALVGNAFGSAIINCYVSGTINESLVMHDDNFGGLIGNAEATDITNSSSECNVNAFNASNIGGLVGQLINSSSIIGSNASGTVNGAFYVGGLVGYLLESEIINSYSEGNVNGLNDVGGFVGIVQINTTIIRGSYSIGNVRGDYNVGGFVGQISDASIIDSYSNSSVTRVGSGNTAFGGFVGLNFQGSISRCYSVGKVYSVDGIIWNEGGLSDKGFVGEVFEDGNFNMNSNYWDTQHSEQTSTGGAYATGYASAQMVQSMTYVGFDFGMVWQINEGNTYPFFIWQGGPGNHNLVILK